MRRHLVGTIVAHNYIAQARVLARSFMVENPDAQFFTLIIDGLRTDRDLEGLGAVLLPEDLPLDSIVQTSMSTMYDVMEYATALKPALLLHLHHLGALTATYLDPDIRVYSSLAPIFAAAEESGIALTPHTLSPYGAEESSPGPAAIMHSGMYNLGFVSTGPTAIRYLAWWNERLKTDAIVDLERALFTDQRWMDWAPSFENPAILRDPGYNVAYWNLHERFANHDGTRWLVNGSPLVFAHFSGYDPETPWLLSKHMTDNPRILLSERPDVRALADSYGVELVEFGHPTLRKARYRNDHLPGGYLLTPGARRLYRDVVLGRAAGYGDPPAVDADHEALVEWFTERALGGDESPISRTEYALWRSRPDLVQAFPQPLSTNGPEFGYWLQFEPNSPSYGVPRSIRSYATAPALPSDPEPGWNVVGHARAELGIGEAARRLGRAVAHTGVPWSMVGVSLGSASRQGHKDRRGIVELPRFVNTILSVNADQTESVADHLGVSRSRGRLVGYWFWELEQFPTKFQGALDRLDEVWVATEFNHVAVQAVTDKKVRIVPMPMRSASRPTALTRRDLGLPEDRFVFLVNFDYFSVMKRKNPLGALRAYLQAFGPNDGACLVIKSINGHHRVADRERLRIAAAGRPDVILLEDYLSSVKMLAMIELADAFVSLHRSEGYGLNIADAMVAGTPTVVSAYSGNMDFCSPENSFLVPTTLVPVGAGAAPYPADHLWGEPDVDVASALMRNVFDRPEVARARALRAQRDAELLSPRAIGDGIAQFLFEQSVDGVIW